MSPSQTIPASWYRPAGPQGAARSVDARRRKWTSTCLHQGVPAGRRAGQGVMVEDVDGNRFLDFMAGIAVSSTGYGHPKVVAAVKDAADRFLHICGSDFYYEGMAALCERLARIAPGRAKKRVFLTQLGHGSHRRRHQAGPLRHPAHRHHRLPRRVSRAHHRRGDPHVAARRASTPASARCCPTCTTSRTPTATAASGAATSRPAPADCLDAIEQDLFARHLDPHDVAAIFVEPIQGEGGYVVPPPGWLARPARHLRPATASCWWPTRCSRASGRTGKMWACDHEGVEPDILLTAKGLGSGMPIGAHHRQGVDHHLGERLARLDLRRQSGLLRRRAGHARPGRGRPHGQRRRDGRAAHGRACRSWPRSTAASATCAAVGLMVGVEFVKDRATREPAPEIVEQLVQRAFQRGTPAARAPGRARSAWRRRWWSASEDIDTALAHDRRPAERDRLSAAPRSSPCGRPSPPTCTTATRS